MYDFDVRKLGIFSHFIESEHIYSSLFSKGIHLVNFYKLEIEGDMYGGTI